MTRSSSSMPAAASGDWATVSTRSAASMSCSPTSTWITSRAWASSLRSSDPTSTSTSGARPPCRRPAHPGSARYLSPPLFPVRVRDLHTHDLPRGTLRTRGHRRAHGRRGHGHPSGSDGRLPDREGDRTLAYLPDHEPAIGARRFPDAPEWTSGYGLALGVDVLHPRRPVHQRGVPGPEGLGSLEHRPGGRLRDALQGPGASYRSTTTRPTTTSSSTA